MNISKRLILMIYAPWLLVAAFGLMAFSDGTTILRVDSNGRPSAYLNLSASNVFGTPMHTYDPFVRSIGDNGSNALERLSTTKVAVADDSTSDINWQVELYVPITVQINGVSVVNPFQYWELVPKSQADAMPGGTVKQLPNDYNDSTNAKVWVRLSPQ